ncbi:hypothetical protein YC2023_017797 [Brassica napus]
MALFDFVGLSVRNLGHKMVEKSWVHLNRADPGYESGAWEFVRCVGADLRESELIICPCIDCRNVARHSASVIVDHLVTRGMDLSYKMREDWYHHGEVMSGTDSRSNGSEKRNEILGLYQAAAFVDEEFLRHGDLSEVAEGEDKVEDEFLAKLADAETPLYPSCANHSKLSAIVSLFRIKTQSGWSDRSFDLLLETLPQMLPEDNVLHTPLYEVKRFLRSFDMEHGKKGRILSGHNISHILRNYKNDFENVKVTGRKRKINETVGSDSNTDDESSDSKEEEEAVDEEELSRWKKRSIFFKLPYWEDLPVRHNLDVMHVERNVAASLIATLLHCGKSKDGLNARKDLELLGIRKDLHPQPRGKRTYLPPAPWSLSSKEKKVFCKRLSDFRGPDGYCSNISRCVKLEESKISGLKSHDYHVLMQQLLSVAIRGIN